MCDKVCIEVNETVENISVEVRDFSILNIISQDENNIIQQGQDGLLYVAPQDFNDAVKSVNSVFPDENGNVEVLIPVPISNHSELNLDDGTNPHGTTKSDVGLSNVDNTSDLDKPISNDTQNALDLKANTSDLSAVAFSNDYNDLDNLPTIPNNLEELHNVTETNYTTPIDTDSVLTFDVNNSLWKRLTLANIKSNLKTYFDTIYQTALGFTPENVANKATNLTSPDNTKYPTTLAVVNENKKATITVELIDLLTTNFYAPNALRINYTALISGSGTITLKVNDMAYTLGNLITQGEKITVETTTASVYNLIVIYE